jgi:hypothetical protein
VRIIRQYWFSWLGGEQCPAQRGPLTAATVGHPTVVANTHQAFRQHMQQEAPNELLGRQRHFTFLTVVSVIFPAEGDLTILQGDEPVIGDGHAMGVTRQIMQHMLGAAKRLSHIDHPFVLVECVQESGERARFSQPGQRAVEGEFFTAEEAFQRGSSFFEPCSLQTPF